MRPPFTSEQFLDVFIRYNDAVFPAQAVLLIFGLIAVGTALKGTQRGARATFAILGLLWLWMAVAYHLAFFTTLGVVGYVFAVAFAFEGLVFLRLAVAAHPPRLEPRVDARGMVAAVLLAYAVIGYPLAAVAVGHAFPAMPTFGVPCPTTIFTIGLLLLVAGPPPRSALIVPMAWVLVASSAALAFGMWEDVGVAVAGLAAVALLGGAAADDAVTMPDVSPPEPASHPRVRRAARVAVFAGAAVLAGYLAYASAAWLRYGRIPIAEARSATTLDRYVPVYEVRERHETRVAAPAATVFATACAFDLYDSRVVRTLFDARELVMLRHRPSRHTREPFLHAIQAMGWGMLSASGGRELVFGAVTKPWEGDVTFRALPATEFAAFREPGYAKIVWSIAVEPDGPDASFVRTETRVATTDPGSRARFRRYWSFASPGIILIRREALALVKRDAERSKVVAGAGAPALPAGTAARSAP